MTQHSLTFKPIVLFTIDAFDISGVLSLNQQYIEVLHKQGQQTAIIGRQGNLQQPSSYFPHSIVYVIPKNISGSFIGRLLDGRDEIRLLHSIYKKYLVKTIHMSTPWSSLYTLFSPNTWRIRRITTFHGAYDLESKSARIEQQTPTNRFGDFLRYVIQYIGLHASHTVVCCSSYSKRLAKTHFNINEQRIVVIPGYVKEPVGIIASTNTKTTLRMLTIGRAEPRKGIHVLLNACGLLRDRHIPFFLSVASPIDRLKKDNALDAYERLNLFSNVRFYHAANAHEKRMLYMDTDVCIMSSQDLETFGLTVIESLSYGIPVIGTPVGAIPEILRHVDKHLITAGTHAKDIADTIIWFSKRTKHERAVLKEKSLACIRTMFSYKTIEPKIRSLYHIQ